VCCINDLALVGADDDGPPATTERPAPLGAPRSCRHADPTRSDGTVTPMGAVAHLDLDAFFASVAQADHPHLAGEPVAVGNTVVAAASYEARAHGIRSAMAMSHAQRLCPDLHVVAVDIDRYRDVSRQIFDHVAATFPDRPIEQLSIDECFVDVSHLGLDTARDELAALRADIRDRHHLAISVGLGPNKLVAKTASGAAKPDGLLTVADTDAVAFLAPLPVSTISGIGPRTTERLAAIGVHTVGDLRRHPYAALADRFGTTLAQRLADIRAARDTSPVEPRGPRTQIGTQSALQPAVDDLAALAELTDAMTVRICGDLTDEARNAHNVTVKIRDRDYTTITRTRTLPFPTRDPLDIAAAARACLATVADPITRGGVTLIGVSVAGLDQPTRGHPQLLGPYDLTDFTGAAAALRLPERRRHGLRLAGELQGARQVQHPTWGDVTIVGRDGLTVTVDDHGTHRTLDLDHAPAGTRASSTAGPSPLTG
jgi:DNA polymerase-4